MDGLEVSFVEGRVYSRRRDITGKFGGSWQSGVAPSSKVPAVFIFTGEEGEQYGYRDEWDDAKEVFTYTGEGQLDDMTFVRGNRAIRDHVRDGRALHLFEKVDRDGGLYRYVGEMQCDSIQVVRGLDKKGRERDVIQFQLVRVEALGSPDQGGPVESKENGSEDSPSVSQVASLQDLRASAYDAVKPTQGKGQRGAVQRLYDRSKAVVDYVLARADGRCECCEALAPFVRKNGAPYLEAHHIQRLSDKGIDSPENVGAVCPTCHRRIHFGADGDNLNQELREFVRSRERSLSSASGTGSGTVASS